MSCLGKCKECYDAIYSWNERYTCPVCKYIFHTKNWQGDDCFEDHLCRCSKCRKWVCPEFLDTLDVCQNCGSGRCITLRNVQK